LDAIIRKRKKTTTAAINPVRIALIFSPLKKRLILFRSQRLKLYYIAFLFRFAVSPDLQPGTGAIYPLPAAFRANFKDASDMMKAVRKDIAFGATYRLPPCKDRLVFLLERQGGVIRTVYPDIAFDAGRSSFSLFTAKSANCQLFCLYHLA
jgi:hypothetical protein